MGREGWEQAQALLKKGKKREAGQMLALMLQTNASDAEAWYAFSLCVEVKEQQIDCLQRALRYRPDYGEARTALARLTAGTPERGSKATPMAVLPEARPSPPPETTLQKRSAPSRIKKAETHAQTHSWPAGNTTTKIAEYYTGMNKLDRAFFYFFLVYLVLCVLLLFFLRQTIWADIAWALAVIFALKQVVEIWKYQKDSWFKKNTYTQGAVGEMIVGRILDTLGPDFCVWHDLPTVHGNIDHIVLSKWGKLFMVETKANFGEVFVRGGKLILNGAEPAKDMIGQCLDNVNDLRRVVKESTGKEVWVVPILVFTDAYVHNGAPIHNIRVVNKKFLVKAIREINFEHGGESSLWRNIDALDDLFNSGRNGAKELQKENFARLSGWGEKEFAKRRSQKGV